MSNILKDLKDYIANDDRAKLLRLIEDVERVQLFQDDGDYERLEPLITLSRELHRDAAEFTALLTRLSDYVRAQCEQVIRREKDPNSSGKGENGGNPTTH